VSGFSLYISVVCRNCGADLEADLDRQGVLEVEPCSRCLEDEHEKGSRAGYKQAEIDIEAGA